MRTKLRWVMLGSGMVAALAGGMASGQQIQQGNVLDANSRVGSGGFNAPRPLRDFNAANRIMTGNVAGGMAFQGFSPIRDPNSLFLGNTMGSGLLNRGTNSGLPSNYLDNFRRDSFNLEDYRRAGTGWNGMTPYHSPWSTVLNTGAIVAGQNRLGTSQVQNPYQPLSSALAGQRANLLSSVMESSASGNLLRVPNQVVRATTGILENFREAYLVAARTVAAQTEWPIKQPELLQRMRREFATRLLLKRDTGISRLRGQVYPWWNRLLVPTLHPAAVLRGGDGLMEQVRADFALAHRALAEATAVADPAAEQLGLFE
jgi:hypothetical protein